MLLRSQNVHFDGLRLDDVVFIEESVDEEMVSTRVEPQDVLLNITGASIGRCTIAPDSMAAANVNQHVCILRPALDRVTPQFLNLALQSSEIQTAIFSGENGSSREGLNFGQIGELQIILPPLAQQKIIALSTANSTENLESLILEKRRFLKLLAEKRRALIASAVTHGLTPNAPRRDSGIPWLGEIPAHWGISRVAWLFAERDERSQPDLPLLEVSIHGGVRLREFSDVRIEQVAENLNSYKVARHGDISFNKMRMWQGAVGRTPCDGLVSPDYVVANPTVPLNSEYYGRLFQTPALSAEAGKRSHGIVWDRLRLY
jgi:type I restriction enzyme S subunit